MTVERIISLTPSVTETLFALGAGERIVGVTDSCDFPAEANRIPHVRAWFDPDMDCITGLAPDLVVGLQTAHGRLVQDFRAAGIRLELVDPKSVEDALADMLRLGKLLGLEDSARSLVGGLRRRLDKLDARVGKIAPEKRRTASRVLEIDGDRLMVAGPESFQYDVIARAGGVNVTGDTGEAYPCVSFQTFRSWDPDLVFICGYDSNRVSVLRDDPQWRTLSAVKNGRFFQFNCGLTCRTGPRIVDMAEILFEKLYGGESATSDGPRRQG